jgi:tRNA threonylcarbamoyladenosine biosynthesis protein TsaB
MTPTVLAIDTATEQCSVAVISLSHVFERVVPTARGHADMILTLIDDVLGEAELNFARLDGLAFGRGPGSFTGVRIAVGVIQGLSLATRLPVVGVSNLAAVAQRAAIEGSFVTGDRVLVCMDARMQEVYCGLYELQSTGRVASVDDERVVAPDAVRLDRSNLRAGVGTAWRAYPSLQERSGDLPIDSDCLPRAREIAALAGPELAAGRGVDAAHAEPTYLRDQVAWPTGK